MWLCVCVCAYMRVFVCVFVCCVHRRLCQGTLVHDAAANSFSVEWSRDPSVTLSSGHGEEGRGMELSELQLWNGRMYTGDDRTGIVYEIVDYSTANAHVVPRYIFMEGDGETEKGFKTEWVTVKDNKLIVASFGKEYANADGTIKNFNNNWVAIIDSEGRCVSVCDSSVSQGHTTGLGLWEELRPLTVCLLVVVV